MPTVYELNELSKKLISETSKYASKFADCEFYFMPNPSDMDQPNSSAGFTAMNRLVSGIFSNTISLGDEFFGFKATNPEAKDNEEVAAYLASAAKQCMNHLVSSNFSLRSHEMMIGYAVYGTGVMYSELRDNKMVFSTYPISLCGIAEDEYGVVDTITRKFTLSAAAAYNKWGDSLPREIIEQAQSITDRLTKHTFYHIVMPRLSRNEKSLKSTDMPFASYYINEGTEPKIIAESGYQSFPYATPRFYKFPDSAVGQSCGMQALPIMRSLCTVEGSIDYGVEVSVDRPYFMPSDLSNHEFDFSPGAVNFYNPGSGVPVPYDGKIDLNAADNRSEKLTKSLMEVFFADVFYALEGHRNMTAEEVSERMGEKIQHLLPIVGRLYSEFFAKVIEREFELLSDAKIIEPPSNEVANLLGTYQVTYTTKLDQKLAALEARQITDAAMTFTQIADMIMNNPKTEKYYNLPEIFRVIMEGRNVDPNLYRRVKEIEAAQEAEDKAMAKAQADEAASLAARDLHGKLDPMRAPEPGSAIHNMIAGAQ